MMGQQEYINFLLGAKANYISPYTKEIVPIVIQNIWTTKDQTGKSYTLVESTNGVTYLYSALQDISLNMKMQRISSVRYHFHLNGVYDICFNYVEGHDYIVMLERKSRISPLISLGVSEKCSQDIAIELFNNYIKSQIK